MGAGRSELYLWHSPFGEPKRLITPWRGRFKRGGGAGHARDRRGIGGGSYLEGFANIYTEVARAIKPSQARGQKAGKQDVQFPGH
jgi:hypothetical protein